MPFRLKMDYYYIIAILILTIYFLRNAHRKTIELIQLKKEIDSLISSKTDLLLTLDLLKKENTTSKEEVSILGHNLNEQMQQIIPFQLIEELAQKITPEQWIATYEKQLKK